jgi:hypothetical protein
VTGEGSLVKGYDKAKNAIAGFVDALKNLGTDIKIEEVAQKFDAIQSMAEGTARSLGAVFKHFFSDAFKGQIDDVRDYFAELGNMMLEVLAEVFAKMILVKTIGSIFPGMIPFFHQGGMVYHSGGDVLPIRAHAGLAIDEVPIVAQTGEGVLSRRGMRALGGSENLKSLNEGKSAKGNVTINVNQVIQAWDAQDVWRNRKMLSNAIAEDIYNNGKIRSVIRSYT